MHAYACIASACKVSTQTPLTGMRGVNLPCVCYTAIPIDPDHTLCITILIHRIRMLHMRLVCDNCMIYSSLYGVYIYTALVAI
jgi:hypothetical protein